MEIIKNPNVFFKLLDFVVFDQSISATESASSDSDESSKSQNVESANTIVIQMYGINEKGETASIFVNNFEPFFFCKVGDNWKSHDVQQFFDHITGLDSIRYYKDSIVSAKLVESNKLYGFSGGKKSKFVQFTFKTIAALNKVKGLWYNYDNTTGIRRLVQYKYSQTLIPVYESNIPPLLRYFHIQNISPSGWVFIKTSQMIVYDHKRTTCIHEFSCLSRNLKPAAQKETIVPYKICSFDIEASSSHGDFPIPIKSYKRLSTNMLDVYNDQISCGGIDKNVSIPAARTRTRALIARVIKTAFQQDCFDNVDIVYPIKKIGKLELEKYTNTFFEVTLAHVTDAKSAETTIEMMFEKMNASNEGNGDNMEDGSDSDSEPESLAEKKPYPKPRENKMKSANSTGTDIFTLLADDSVERENKILAITQMFGLAGFPKLEGDKITFIGSTFMKNGDTEPYLNHCLAVGTCDAVDGAVIESVESEIDILTQWTELIQRENPDIIIGYNIFGFDYEFMFRRAQENNCVLDFFKFSRNIDESCIKENVNRMTGDVTFDIENTKVVLASGEYDLRYFKMPGRIQIDMYAYFRRDFNLSSYKLDDVAGEFISDYIKTVKYMDDPEETHLYSKNLLGLHQGDFIHILLSGFTPDYLCNGRKFQVKKIVYDQEHKDDLYNIIVISGKYEIQSDKSLKWCMSKDDVTPQDIFRLSGPGSTSADRAIVAKYCIQDCNLVHHLMRKIDVITGYVEMARICSVPISYLVFRGQGIKLTSYVAKKCYEKNTRMPDLEKSRDNEGYEGAIVLPPKCNMYMDNPVACVDYSSLYPSSMISQNYSHDSKVWSKEYDLEGRLIRITGEQDRRGNFIYDNLPNYQYIDVEFDTYKYLRDPAKPKSREVKTKVGKMIVRWAQLPNDEKSIMPSILEELLKARSDTKKQAKTEKDPFMQNILDKRQLGYKVTANSLYGQCGAKTSTFYEKDVAACTTATGRLMITYARRMIEEIYGDLVYDTASQGPVRCRAEYIYGDSVANYTPVTVRIDKKDMVICTIEDLAATYGSNRWVSCEELGKQTKEFCELSGVESWTESGWTPVKRVIRHALAQHKKMMRITTYEGSEVDVTDDHSLLNPNGMEISPRDCSWGTELLSCKIDGIQTYETIETICIIPEYEGFVYDLTTENHHFAAGIGNLIVHNTDSVFFTFNLEHPETKKPIRGKPALECTIEIAQDAAELCTSYLKPPMALAYEKTLMPFILLSKKRYVGMLYEEDANKGKLKYMGLSLKRRDACDYLKDTYGGILNRLMIEQSEMAETNPIQSAIDFLHTSLGNLINGTVSMEKLAITKALRSDYKNPKTIAHRVLADRIGQRDPGNKPKPGDRMKFLFITNPNKKALLGERIETPDYIISSSVKIDYTYYITNQLMKPLQQLFGLALDKIMEEGKNAKTPAKRMIIRNAQSKYKSELQKLKDECGDDIEIFMKKKEKICARKVKELLFDETLTKIFNSQNNIQTMDYFLLKK